MPTVAVDGEQIARPRPAEQARHTGDERQPRGARDLDGRRRRRVARDDRCGAARDGGQRHHRTDAICDPHRTRPRRRRADRRSFRSARTAPRSRRRDPTSLVAVPSRVRARARSPSRPRAGRSALRPPRRGARAAADRQREREAIERARRSRRVVDSPSLLSARPRSSRSRPSTRSSSIVRRRVRGARRCAVVVGMMPARPSTMPPPWPSPAEARRAHRRRAAALDRERDRRTERGRERHLVGRERLLARAAARARRSTAPPPISGTPTNTGNRSSPRPGTCLYAASAAACAADTGRMHSATRPVMPSPTRERRRADRARREAVVAAHDEASSSRRRCSRSRRP